MACNTKIYPYMVIDQNDYEEYEEEKEHHFDEKNMHIHCLIEMLYFWTKIISPLKWKT